MCDPSNLVSTCSELELLYQNMHPHVLSELPCTPGKYSGQKMASTKEKYSLECCSPFNSPGSVLASLSPVEHAIYLFSSARKSRFNTGTPSKPPSPTTPLTAHPYTERVSVCTDQTAATQPPTQRSRAAWASPRCCEDTCCQSRLAS